METTTIQIYKNTLERLQLFKQYPRQSYNELLNILLNDAEEETITPEEIEEIKQGLEDVRKGRVHKIEDVAKEIGIQLKVK